VPIRERRLTVLDGLRPGQGSVMSYISGKSVNQTNPGSKSLCVLASLWQEKNSHEGAKAQRKMPITVKGI
jgi:hypothetical protein